MKNISIRDVELYESLASYISVPCAFHESQKAVSTLCLGCLWELVNSTREGKETFSSLFVHLS